MFLKVVLFWFQGRGRPYKGGTPYVATDSKPLILGLSNEVSFVSELSLKGGQTTQNTFPKICCTKIPVHQCCIYNVRSQAENHLTSYMDEPLNPFIGIVFFKK